MDYLNSNIQFRQIDDLGRVVIPKEFRKQLGIDPLSKINFKIEGNSIIIRPHDKKMRCMVTGKTEGVKAYGKYLFLSEEGLQLIKKELNDYLD